ncbi:MAG: copper homeostasis protein CutC [Flammeovirgaceae bacterium]
MKFEYCIDSLEGALAAKKYGADRVELCSALQIGGLTPSYGLIQSCTQVGIEVHAMIRPIEGDFVYSTAEIVMMEQDITIAHQAGAKGVVFGCLNNHNMPHLTHNERLLKTAKNLGLTVTFHRAFDLVAQAHQALAQLIDLGFDRLLTSGQQAKAIQGIDLIQNLVQQAKGSIEIMVGSGVNASNAKQLAAIGVDALHFSIHQTHNATGNLGMGIRSSIDEMKIAALMRLFE